MKDRSKFNKKICKASYKAGVIFIFLFLLTAIVGTASSANASSVQSPQSLWKKLLANHPFFSNLLKTQNSIQEESVVEESTLLVKFKPQVSDSARLSITNAYGLKQESVISQIDVFIFKIPEHAQQTVLNALQKNPNIEFAEPDQFFEPELVSNDALRNGAQYPHSTMRLPQAWDVAVGSTTVRVSNPDTGIDVTHPDLAPNLLMDLAYNSADGSSDVLPSYPHGTSTAGCIGAKTNNELGIASSSWNVEIIPIKVSNRDDGYASSTAICKAITYAADHGARVVSVSYGVGGSSSVNSAGQYLRQKTEGLLFVSAGNQNSYSSALNYPYIIVVGATDSKDNKATFSNYGPFIDLVAPGVSVYTTSGPSGYGSKSGTSFSSPLAASVAAYLFSVYPSATASEVEQALFNGAIDLGEPGRDDYFGYGRVDAFGALAFFDSGEPIIDTPEPDTIPPTIEITSPEQGSTVSGSVTIAATASDNIGVTKVEFYLGTTLLATDTTEPYAYSWDTSSVANGEYMLQAKAYDAMNNIGSSAFVEVIVDNQIVVLLSFSPKPPSVTTTVSEATISWNTNIESTGLILYGTSQNELNLQEVDLTSGTAHVVTLTGLSRNTRYYYRIVATNAQNSDDIILSNIFNFKTKNK